MTDRTFYGDLYEQALTRFREKQQATAQHLADAAKSAHGLGVNGLCSRLAVIRKGVLARKPPGRTWEDVVGFTTKAYVAETKPNGEPTKHGGRYTCRVKRADNPAGYVVVMTGPKGEVEWWEGCGKTGRAAFNEVGGWNHHPRMFFGLEARKGKPRRRRRSRRAD